MSAEPIATVPIRGVAVRFYAAPSGQLEVPWSSFVDLCAAARLPHAVRDELLRKARDIGSVGVVTLFDGTVIQSHPSTRLLIDVAIRMGAVPSTFASDYEAAGVGVLHDLHADLPRNEIVERIAAMAQNTHGISLAELVATP